MARFWNFIRNQSAENAEEEIELRIEGEIIDDDYAWLYEWFGISASSPNAFKQELSQYKGMNIVVWIDSYGGSVFAAAGIYNALMEHKKSGVKVTAKVTKAMSAATIPMMAADERLMSPGGIYMMHNPLTEVYGYASDLRKAADVLDVVKETIINAYQLGTGKSRAKISSLMDEETYMDAKTAIKEGFATGMLYSGEQKEEKNVEDIVNFTFNRLEIKNASKDSMNKFFEVAKKNETQSASAPSAPQANEKVNQPAANITNNNQKEAKKIMNLEELRTAYPDLVAQIENNAKEEGAKEERQRIKDIEAISNTIDPALVNKAKFEEPINAEKLAFEAMKQNAQKGQEYLANVAIETQSSGTQAVAAAANNAASPGEQKPKKIENVISEVGAKFERTRKGDK